jgi:hypothetical protein
MKPKSRIPKALTLGAILFSQAAVAKQVDYIQCEAMEKARDRVAQSPILLAGMELVAAREENRILQAGGLATRADILRARQKYVIELRQGIGDPELVNEMKKIQRIEADMKAAGCP